MVPVISALARMLQRSQPAVSMSIERADTYRYRTYIHTLQRLSIDRPFICHTFLMMMMNLAAVTALLLTPGALAFHHQPPAAPKRPGTQLFGVGSAVRRARDSLLSRERSREDLKIGIAGFYDRSSKLWEDVWGEHMHHGVSIALWGVGTPRWHRSSCFVSDHLERSREEECLGCGRQGHCGL